MTERSSRQSQTLSEPRAVRAGRAAAGEWTPEGGLNGLRSK